MPPSCHNEQLSALPAIMPPFVHKIGQIAAVNGLGNAILEVCADAGIGFELEGDLEGSGGILIASDHRQRTEPLMVQAATAISGREASHIIAMPTSLAGRIIQGSSETGARYLLPVMPKRLAVENQPALTDLRTHYRRLRFPAAYRQTRTSLTNMNTTALQEAAARIADGHAVTICPGGNQVEAGSTRWQNGLGRIVLNMKPETQQETQIALFRPDDYSNRAVFGALLRHDAHLPTRKQTITLRTTKLGSAASLFGELLTSKDPHAAREITEITRQHYIATLGKAS